MGIGSDSLATDVNTANLVSALTTGDYAHFNHLITIFDSANILITLDILIRHLPHYKASDASSAYLIRGKRVM